ncbi:sugar ABC transporter substrate-binding protein [Nocardioides marmoriginsengisoli]|uniref:Sugar ABC transporter substrate-binding protein n=1 Tax=Nocardioides marmoriginsengisoli TaxID=661483 RepID=A0A3N0CCW7_9ACTN|nr:sugar ABC transporter substrate-binding protein [Nocardioides marmoriginsengisoli]RNL61304.1 sugar ABC transporter substrate-binding protein [Nocardioides marmoriginsengisoli]
MLSPTLRHPLRAAAAVVVAVLAASTLAACGSSDEKSDSPGAAASGAWLDEAKAIADKAVVVPTEIAVKSLGAVKPAADMTVFFVGCDQSIPGCVAQVEGVRQATDALGYELKICDAKTDVASFQNCMSQAVNAKPDVIVNNARPAADAAESYAKAHSEDIPVIGQFTSEQPDAEKGNVVEVGNVCELEGQLLGSYVVAESKGKANVAIFADTVYGCNGQRAEGVKSALDKCETCEVTVDRFSAATAMTDLPPALQAKIQSKPNLNWIIGTPGFSGVLAADAVRQAGKADAIDVGTFDGDEPSLALVRKGDIIKVDVTSGVYENGWTVLDAALRLKAGQAIPNNIENPTQLLMTKESAPSSGTYEGAQDFREQFKALWGVS